MIENIASAIFQIASNPLSSNLLKYKKNMRIIKQRKDKM